MEHSERYFDPKPVKFSKNQAKRGSFYRDIE